MSFFDNFKSQSLDIGRKLTYSERAAMYRRMKRYEETKSPLILRELQDDFGFSIDEKDYGADQNVEKSERDYSHIEDNGSTEPY